MHQVIKLALAAALGACVALGVTRPDADAAPALSGPVITPGVFSNLLTMMGVKTGATISDPHTGNQYQVAGLSVAADGRWLVVRLLPRRVPRPHR